MKFRHFLPALALAALLGRPCAGQPAKQGADLLKTDIMGVFAHPDDETGVAATMAAYALGKGKVVANVYCTRGEGGGNMVGSQWGESLGVLREAELRDCLTRLGVRYCYFLDRRDFFYTESLAATFTKWGREETLERLTRLVRALRPEVIVTMNPVPSPGQHGHHQAAAVLATEVFAAAADPARFPGQLHDEGLAVWQVRKLYYSGGGNGPGAKISVNDPLPGGMTSAQVAGEAMSHHRSQAFGNPGNSPWMGRPQGFTLVKSLVPFENDETDLLRGLPVADHDTKPVSPPAPPRDERAVALEFAGRPAIESFFAWARSRGVEHVAAKLTPDISLVAGEENDVVFRARNQTAQPQHGRVRLVTPAGWQAIPAEYDLRLPPGATATFHCRVIPPTGSPGDADLAAGIDGAANQTTASIRLHPVPRLDVAATPAPPALDGSDSGWESLPEVFISPTNLVSGRVKDAADSSARFRVTYDAQALYVDVRVADDVVVTNIAPDDIRGHWRTDSLEICLDPAGGAENTIGCFKVGIFPSDSAGAVRAARDADANQGPIEETAPGMRLSSRRVPGGYRVQAAIPLRDLGVEPVKGKRVGFNLIIYDGDKAGAARGENINKSRIAWAPRSGVQGRPEDWGRLDFR